MPCSSQLALAQLARREGPRGWAIVCACICVSRLRLYSRLPQIKDMKKKKKHKLQKHTYLIEPTYPPTVPMHTPSPPAVVHTHTHAHTHPCHATAWLTQTWALGQTLVPGRTGPNNGTPASQRA